VIIVALFLLPENPLITQKAEIGKTIYITAVFLIIVIYILLIVLTARFITIKLVIFFLLRAAALISF
jgi:hypothetical protein